MMVFNYLVVKKVGIDPLTEALYVKVVMTFLKIKEKFDCVFIILHVYFKLKDIFNSLKFLNNNGVILHDCLPNNYFAQATLDVNIIGMEMFGEQL